MITRDELRVAFNDAGLGRIADTLARLSDPCVLVRTHAHPYDDFPIGRSRIGGAPDLADAIDWPCWRGQPLSFLAQFNLSELNQFSCCRKLPPAGHLWFFYGVSDFHPYDRGSWQVIYSQSDAASLRRRQPPTNSQPVEYSPCNLTFHDFFSIPGPETLSVAPLQLTLDEIEQIEEINRDLHEMIPSGPEHHYEPHHQLLGHPAEIQGEMQRECQFGLHEVHRHLVDDRIPELERGAADWRLLFQLDTDDAPGKPMMMWGDCGRLFFWIRNQDLLNKAFDNSWMILQCS